MTRFYRADRTSNVTSANACYEIIPGGVQECSLIGIEISLVTAAATVIGLGRPAAIGITPTTPLLVQKGSPTDPTPVTTTAMAWGTGPTVPTHFLKRWSFPAVIGSGIEHRFLQEISIPVGGSLILWNILGGATLDVSIVIEE